MDNNNNDKNNTTIIIMIIMILLLLLLLIVMMTIKDNGGRELSWPASISLFTTPKYDDNLTYIYRERYR